MFASQLVKPHQPTFQPFVAGNPFSARWVNGIEELEDMIPAWEQLADNAVCRNPSFEPNYLIPALRHLAEETVRVLVIERTTANDSESELVGLMPLVSRSLFKIPVAAMEVWKHEQCFDSTPLLSREFASQAWIEACQFLGESGAGLLSLDTVSAEPSFQSVLDSGTDRLKLPSFQREKFERAAFTPSASCDEYLAQFTSSSVKKNVRRLSRRLADLGGVTCETSNETSDFQTLANDFMRIEASGWKGKSGTALLCSESTRRFYEELIRRSADAGKARFLSLRLDGKPIAMLSDIRSGHQVYSYKTAFDNDFSKFSPGLQIEVRNVEFLHSDGIVFADSCTAPDNSTINRIWGQKVGYQKFIVCLKPGISRMLTRSLPVVQAIARRIKQFKSK